MKTLPKGTPRKTVVFYVDGARYEAPEAWMIGAHFIRVRRGMEFRAAHVDVMRHWAEQTQLADAAEATL